MDYIENYGGDFSFNSNQIMESATNLINKSEKQNLNESIQYQAQSLK